MNERALMDSARSVPPKLRLEWLYHRGIGMPGYASSRMSDSGLSLVGKWGRGPAAEVTGKDTLVVLTLGSEVALLSFAEPDSPRVLSEIQFPSLTAQSYLEDSLLYTSSNADLEVWNVANPTQPVKRGVLPAPVGDFWIRDTFLYYIRRDTFHVISIANPASLYELGSCLGGRSVTSGSGNTVVVLQSGGLAFVDVSNPASPHEVGTYPCGHTLSATARGNLVCASYEETSDPYPVRFITLDISTPSSPRLLAKLNDLGGYDIFLDGPLAFVSGRVWADNPPFQILSIADSAHPAFIDSCRTTTRYPWGVWENAGLNRALVADENDGLAIVDISNLNNPVLDTSVMVAASAEDVSVDGHYCYVADGMAGLRILDVADPTKPSLVGGVDTSYEGASSYSVAVRDSIMYACWFYPYFRTYDVSNPAQPQLLGACFPPDQEPEDIVLRDTFAYSVIDYMFYTINIARSRAPVVVGTCALQNASSDLCVLDSLAYVGNWPSPIINISDPAHPDTIGNFPMPLGGVYVRDTFAYLAMDYDSMFVYSVANPAAPIRLGSLDFAGGQHYAVFNVDIEVVDTIAYIGGTSLKTVSVADPRNPREVGPRWKPPSLAVRRLAFVAPYLYLACTDGGVCIAETLNAGVSERTTNSAVGRISVVPSITRGPVRVTASDIGRAFDLQVFDVAGNLIRKEASSTRKPVSLDLTSAPDGVYLVMVKTEVGMSTMKVVKTRR
jgi:hypothetical protein